MLDAGWTNYYMLLKVLVYNCRCCTASMTTGGWFTFSLAVAHTECSITWYINRSVKLALRTVVCRSVIYIFVFGCALEFNTECFGCGRLRKEKIECKVSQEVQNKVSRCLCICICGTVRPLSLPHACGTVFNWPNCTRLQSLGAEEEEFANVVGPPPGVDHSRTWNSCWGLSCRSSHWGSWAPRPPYRNRLLQLSVECVRTHGLWHGAGIPPVPSTWCQCRGLRSRGISHLHTSAHLRLDLLVLWVSSGEAGVVKEWNFGSLLSLCFCLSRETSCPGPLRTGSVPVKRAYWPPPASADQLK